MPLVLSLERDAWAAMFELSTNPDYEGLDLDLLSDAAKEAWNLLQDLMKAAADESVDLSSMEDPVNQTAIDDSKLSQVEKFSAITLQVPRRIGDSTEAVTVYGIEPGSKYWTYADVSNGHVLTGEGLLAKCDVELGEAFKLLLTYMMASYAGNFVIQMPLGIMAREVGLGFLTYLVVVCLHIRAIRRVSLSLALKVQE